MSTDDYQFNYEDFLKKIGKGLDKIDEDDIIERFIKHVCCNTNQYALLF